VEEHLLTCEYVSSSASGFSAVDKGIANRIKQDIQSLDLTASEMYTVSCFGQSIIGLLVTCWAENYPSILEVFGVTITRIREY
jgi:hypothetical protein